MDQDRSCGICGEHCCDAEHFLRFPPFPCCFSTDPSILFSVTYFTSKRGFCHVIQYLKVICKGESKGVTVLFITEQRAMKTYWGSRSKAPRILTSTLDGGEWSATRSCRSPPGKESLVPMG